MKFFFGRQVRASLPLATSHKPYQTLEVNQQQGEPRPNQSKVSRVVGKNRWLTSQTPRENDVTRDDWDALPGRSWNSFASARVSRKSENNVITGAGGTTAM